MWRESSTSKAHIIATEASQDREEEAQRDTKSKAYKEPGTRLESATGRQEQASQLDYRKAWGETTNDTEESAAFQELKPRVIKEADSSPRVQWTRQT